MDCSRCVGTTQIFVNLLSQIFLFLQSLAREFGSLEEANNIVNLHHYSATVCGDHILHYACNMSVLFDYHSLINLSFLLHIRTRTRLHFIHSLSSIHFHRCCLLVLLATDFLDLCFLSLGDACLFLQILIQLAKIRRTILIHCFSEFLIPSMSGSGKKKERAIKFTNKASVYCCTTDLSAHEDTSKLNLLAEHVTAVMESFDLYVCVLVYLCVKCYLLPGGLMHLIYANHFKVNNGSVLMKRFDT